MPHAILQPPAGPGLHRPWPDNQASSFQIESERLPREIDYSFTSAIATMWAFRLIFEELGQAIQNASGYDYCAPAAQNGLQSAHRYDRLCGEDALLSARLSGSRQNPGLTLAG